MVHIVGAGLGGLSAAVDLVDAGYRVAFYEAAKTAGGRCRSFVDTVLNIVVDNGSHLLLSGNHAAVRYLTRGDGLKEMTRCEAAIPFADLKSGERWTLRPNSSRVPWWILDVNRRVPGTRARNTSRRLNLLRARTARAKSADVVDSVSARSTSGCGDRFMLAALNVEPAKPTHGSRRSFVQRDVQRRRQGVPAVDRPKGLSSAISTRRSAYLDERGVAFRLRRTCYAASASPQRSRASGRTQRGQDPRSDREDQVLLAVPPVVARAYVPGVTVPKRATAIVSCISASAPGRSPDVSSASSTACPNGCSRTGTTSR